MCALRVKHVYCGTRDAYACGDDARADARLMRARSRRHTRARRETRRAWTRAIDASSREGRACVCARGVRALDVCEVPFVNGRSCAGACELCRPARCVPQPKGLTARGRRSA